jgi:hypothetical protein
VRSVTCRDGDGRDGDGALVVEVTPEPGADVSLELYAANVRAELLSDALGARVEVVEAAAETPVAAQA